MLTKNPQTIPIPTLNPSPAHRFSPYLIHELCVAEHLPPNFRKQYHKYIHRLSFYPSNKPFLQRIPMPKTLHSLNIDGGQPGQNLPIVKKFVKPYRKSLRILHGSASHPKIQELLPLLADLDVNPTKESLEILSLHSNFKKLRFILLPGRRRNPDEEGVLMEYQAQLSKNLVRIKGLKRMSMVIMGQKANLAIPLLEMIDQNLPLDSLEHWGLSFVTGFLAEGTQELHKRKANISKVLARLTSLSSDNLKWYSFIVSSGKLDNLSVLDLNFASNEIYLDSKGLLWFHSLPKLREFNLHFTAHSETSERNFFENFTLPSSLEDFSLILTGFTLSGFSSNNENTQFLSRLQGAKGVKALELTIMENANNSAFTAKFACVLIKCFKNLETLDCKNYREDSFLFRADKAQVKPLDFQDFWTAVFPSKETLQSISVGVNEIIFPEDINVLETGFPRLQKLELLHNVSSAAELGKFCQKILSLREIYLKGVKLTDEEKLKIFLDDMKEIPEGANFELYLTVGDIKQKPLMDCLKKYIEDVQVKGQLGMYFNEVQVEDKEEFEEILKMAEEKKCFQPFQMEMKNSQVSSWQMM